MSRAKYASNKILDNYYKELGTILAIDDLENLEKNQCW